MLITRGWPSTCYEAIDLITLLTDPGRHALGYPRFGAHGYDIGASILSVMCLDYPDRVIGQRCVLDQHARPGC